RLRPRRSLLWNRLLRVRYAELCITGDRSGQRVSVTYRGDRGGEIAAVAVALARILDQRGLDQCTYATGHVRRKRRRHVADVHHRDRHRVFRTERAVAGETLIAAHRERVDIAGWLGSLAESLFGSDVLRGPHHHAGTGDGRGVGRLGYPEVGDLYLPSGCDQDVARFDVAVYQTVRVGLLECVARLLQHVNGAFDRDAPLPG